MKELETILAKDPGYNHADEVHYQLGLDLEKKCDPVGAAREFAQSLQLNPNFIDAQKHLQAIREPSGKNVAK